MNERYLQQSNESEFEWGLRLIGIKIEENPSDLDWSDIVDLLKLDIHKDTLRKASQTQFGGYAVYKYFIENAKKNITEDKVLDEIDIKTREMHKERIKLQAQKIEYNKMLREKSREELIVEQLRDIVPTIEAPVFNPICNYSENNKEFLLCFGDIHYDKFFESVNNSYSIEEIHRRFQVLLEEMINIIRKEEITKLYVLNCGDSLEGLLRISALKTLRVGLLESVVQFSRFMAEWLNNLSQFVEIVYYHVPTANHSELRMFNQKAGETDENLERVIVNYIHDLLRDNPRIEVPITTDKNYINFELLDYNFVALHGDGIKSVKNSLKDLSMLHRKFYDFCIMGHYHSGIETTVAEGITNNVEVIVVPSIVGSDTYSDKLMVGSKSSAKLLVFEENKGHTQSYNIILN